MPGRGNSLSEGSEVGLRGPAGAAQLPTADSLPAPDCDLGRHSVLPAPHSSLNETLPSRVGKGGAERRARVGALPSSQSARGATLAASRRSGSVLHVPTEGC